MSESTLAIAVVGSGRWALRAHLPGWQRDERCRIAALVDSNPDALAEAGERFAVERRHPASELEEVLSDPEIDVVDVVTSNHSHFPVSMAALEAGKHVLCEKPVNSDYRETRRAAELAAAKSLRTKLGFTFRYAPAVLYAKRLIDDGFVGEPYLLNAFEQNSQWIDPSTPLRQVDRPGAPPGEVQVSSIEGYGAPVIDIMHWWLDAPLRSVVGTMRNFVPERMVRDTGRMQRMNIDDGDMWICEFEGGPVASVQSSYVTVGNYPGIEVRIYGSKGAIIVRLVEERGICQTIKTATKDAVEFEEIEIPGEYFPAGMSSRDFWPELFYTNLVADFASEILDPGRPSQGDFAQGALVQETINAFEASFRRRAWVDFPLGRS
ncbi:MAG TPA: Gfo/Idh/MocA family oxidoreductase [Acidimicrobiales bacterium]|nr:Gfo/Idh/MocA family oxidoreductase [Acidimicrobiales bacterium]